MPAAAAGLDVLKSSEAVMDGTVSETTLHHSVTVWLGLSVSVGPGEICLSPIRFVPKSTEPRNSPDAFQKEKFTLHKDGDGNTGEPGYRAATPLIMQTPL